MLKTLGSTKSTTQPEVGRVGVGGGSRAERDSRCKFGGSEVGDDKVDDVEVGDNEVGKKVQIITKSKKLSKSKKMVRSDFFIRGARLAFIKLKQGFVKASTLYHFDQEYYIWVETDASSYAIGGVFYQLTLDDLS